MAPSHAAVLERTDRDERTGERWRFPRWLIIAAVVTLALAAIGFAVLVRHWPFSRENVTQALEETFHGTVQFTNFHNTFFPHPGCIGEGGTLVHPSSPPGSPPLISVQKFILRASYLDLLLRPSYVSQIELQGFRIQVPPLDTRLKTPHHPEQPSTTRIGEVVANNALLEVGRAKGDPLRFAIHSLTLTSVSRKKPFTYDVSFLNALPAGEIQSHGHFGPWNSADPGKTPVSGTYKFENADLSSLDGVEGVLSSHDDFAGSLQQMETHGTVDIPDFKVKRAGRSVPLHASFHAFVDALNGDVQLEHVDTTVVKTLILASGTVAGKPGQHGKTASLDVHVKDGRIQDVFRLFVKAPRSPVSGIISFRARVEVPPDERPFLQQVILKGDFGIEGGRFTKSETQGKVASLSERAQGKKPDQEDDDPAGVISNLDGHVNLKNGVATLTQISFEVPSAEAHMHGTFNLMNDKLDFHGTLKTDSDFSKMSGGGIKSIFLRPFDALFKKKPKGAEIPVKMTGTYYHPEYGLELTGGKKK
jgi:hypothetical protein